MRPPERPRIYHICHVDRLPSIVADGHLWCDREIAARTPPGTVIGMRRIKARRLGLPLSSHPGLCVGDCVPFYFGPRSVMLFLIHRRHRELVYQGGQEAIVHLEADLNTAVDWARSNGQRWAFTLSNASSYYFQDRADLALLGQVDWEAVGAGDWASCKEAKQAEFLLEHRFPWHLVRRIGVHSAPMVSRVNSALSGVPHRPRVEVRPEWYYPAYG